MKQLKWTFLGLVGLITVLVASVNITAISPDDEPMPDRAMVISLPGGAEATLGDLVDALSPAAEAGSEVVEDATAEPAPSGMAALGELENSRLRGRRRGQERPLDLIDLAEMKLDEGDPEAAIALLRSVSRNDPRYAKARRRLGWDCYAKGLGDPARGVAHVNASVLADPFSGNAWQDASRVYMQRLGLPVR